MKKIKLFTAGGNENLDSLEERINRFIKDKKVIDIKFSSSISSYKEGFDWIINVLVIYEDEKD